MTPYKNFSSNTSWPRRLRRGGMFVAVAALLAAHTTACGGGGDDTDWEQVTTYEVTKGVVTTLEETKPGEFSIVDERVVEGKDASRVVIRYLDGRVDSLNLDQARGLVQAPDTVYQTVRSHHSSGLGSVLWWGAMGYMMGRSFGSPSPGYIYRDDERRGGYSGGGGGGGAYYRSQAAEELRRTAVPRTEMRPVKGKSGFFRGVRGSGRG